MNQVEPDGLELGKEESRMRKASVKNSVNSYNAISESLIPQKSVELKRTKHP